MNKDRQNEIRQTAYKEFALNDFKNASLSNIVKNLRLAKGSFYRYFESKIDLYNYLLEYTMQLRMQTLNKLVNEEKSNFFSILVENFRHKVAFDLQHPLESIFTYRVLLETNTPELKQIINNFKQGIYKYTEILLENFVHAGLLRQDIDIKLSAFLIFQIQVGLFDYLSTYKGIDFMKNIKEGKTIYTIKEEEVMEIVYKMVDIIKHGINRK
ncbi:MAG: TetR/AcrR family transcriptional regulator [Bacteroidales bacterium]|nr:TetR/AcrR family transcriptional regulator [Bacteroidales bacterium]